MLLKRWPRFTESTYLALRHWILGKACLIFAYQYVCETCAFLPIKSFYDALCVFANFALDPLLTWGYHSQPTAHLGVPCWSESATVHALSTMSNADTSMVWHQSRKSPNRRTSWRQDPTDWNCQRREFCWEVAYCNCCTTPANKKNASFVYVQIILSKNIPSCGCIGHHEHDCP